MHRRTTAARHAALAHRLSRRNTPQHQLARPRRHDTGCGHDNSRTRDDALSQDALAGTHRTNHAPSAPCRNGCAPSLDERESRYRARQPETLGQYRLNLAGPVFDDYPASGRRLI